MNFPKDILIIDFETTGIDPYSSEPIQIGAILLDKDTLEEKSHFVSKIAADLTGVEDITIKYSGITQKDLDGAPTQAEVGQKFLDQFGTDVMLSSWVEHLDRRMLKKLMDAAGTSYRKFDYHYLDIWPAAYIHLLKNGYSGSVRSEEMFQAFGFKERGKHDALEDCRLAADALRKVLS
jgi:DNA polymerase III epsilon subunit-like protein